MPDDRKRLFFALWPDIAARDAIVERTAALVEGSRGRAVKPENLHITLAFLHSVETSLIPCIESAARRAAGEPFDLELSQVGCWNRSRILWLAPARDSEGAGTPSALAEALWRELEVCGFTPEQRRYSPHITLARDAKLAAPPVTVASMIWQVKQFVLIESITGQRQSKYIVLNTFPLMDPSGFHGNSTTQ